MLVLLLLNLPELFAQEALAAYQEALKASTSSSEKTLRGNVHKNMAACHLKLVRVGVEIWSWT